MENTNTVTVKEIFDQIVALQMDMTGNPESQLYHMNDALRAVFGEDAGCLASEDYEGVVARVCEPFALREATYQRLLALYEKMYNDCKNGVQ